MEQTQDPIKLIEKEVRRERDAKAAAEKMQAARSGFVMGTDANAAFFATLALRLAVHPKGEGDAVQTASVNGETLVYDPAWVASLEQPQVRGLIAHEVMHCVMEHMARRGDRDKTRWNLACDYAVNGILHDAGFRLPDEGYRPGVGKAAKYPKGLTAEEYYSLIENEPKGDQPGGRSGDRPAKGKQPSGKPTNDPGGCGGVSDCAKDPASQEAAKAKWKMAVASAANAAKQRGDMTGEMKRIVQATLDPTQSWQQVLQRFIDSAAKNDYSWRTPNRRFIGDGLYLPSVQSDAIGDIFVSIDTSGSVSQDELDTYAAELEAIGNAYPCTLHIVYNDTKVYDGGEWTREDGPLELEPIGGGGTNHIPVFEHIENLDYTPVCVLCFTDLHTRFPSEEPDTPVLWVNTGGSGKEAPFGDTVQVIQGDAS